MDTNDYYKVLIDFEEFKKDDILLIDDSTHWCVVKVATPTTKTVYTKLSYYNWPKAYRSRIWTEEGKIRKLSISELIKIRHHLTWRMLCCSANFYLNPRVDPQIKKPRLLPSLMCYDCMRQGNPMMTKRPHRVKTGICHVCDQEKVLHNTVYGWPLDLRSKGFSSVIGPVAIEMNELFYKNNYREEDWWYEK